MKNNSFKNLFNNAGMIGMQNEDENKSTMNTLEDP